MSTRGFVGMVRNRRTRITYVTHDAYPDFLGMNTLLFAKANLGWMDLVAEQFFALTKVDPTVNPTPEQLAQLKERLGALSFPGRFDLVEELTTWDGLENLAHGDLGVFLTAGFLPVLSDEPVTRDTLPKYLEWGYLINLDSREVEAYRILSWAGMQPYTWRISFNDLAPLLPEELLDLADTMKSELDKMTPEREAAEKAALRALLDEEREEIRQEREVKERKDKG